ncbi:signal transduction histidine kinase [Altererythrobacter atlanticus]|uniref:histidine kinase n=1 Tax=Croceibacterium atlanticum TaxID=1267766 RepID=A0A0F7KQD7_9SPHN|nr:PAS domain-containing sensor histidine kinase [Croceibacterium atlanticum]AKH41764.1 Sensor protein DivL [Croceibacterium atlanticum]MBB5733229.1 signal transduction histidine kinase [Croceibacterium atlanticum]
MELSPIALVLLGLLLAGWTFGAVWLVLAAQKRARQARTARGMARRLTYMIEDSPAIPLLVRPDGRIEGPDRLAAWLGFDALPDYLSELAGEDAGLDADDLAHLGDAVRRTQKTASPFRMVVTPVGSRKSLALRGHQADPVVAQSGTALVWWFDFSESQSELSKLRAEAAGARTDFAALVGLIEAAPMPMWFRSDDAELRLVNSAYVKAVGAQSADSVVKDQIELIEPVDGLSAAQIAQQAREQDMPFERIVQATVGSQRRTLRVSDLPLGKEGVAGYAIDIEEMEEQARAFRAFREAQRSMLDQLSVGVAQFNADQLLEFANQPFRRIFALPGTTQLDPPPFDRFLDIARDAGRLPEVRDFPAWRKELTAIFTAGEAHEDAWTLHDGTHLRIVAQPMPDGGLVFIAEDRSEQLALSATRDTLLRTRTATFDSLFESLAVFAPDGRMQLWNRRFPEIWGLPEEYLDEHPRADELLDAIGPHLARPAQRKAIGDVVRSATLDRKQRSGRVQLSDGRTLEFAGVPLPDGNGLLTVLDVTDSKKAEDALRERASALEEADAVKTRFLANMSYEFRTPLTSIGGFAELLQSGVAGDLSDQAKEYVDAIISSVERLSSQIETVLDLTQSEAGLLPLATEEVELLPFVTQIVREREEAIENGGLSLDLRGDRSAGKVMADKRQLGRALGNILDNSISATPKGGRILVALSRRQKGVKIVISDNGQGMKPSELARALDGYRLDADGKPAKRRGGLGLPLARQLIEAHGGRLELQSEKGSGTTATILLP